MCVKLFSDISKGMHGSIVNSNVDRAWYVIEIKKKTVYCMCVHIDVILGNTQI